MRGLHLVPLCGLHLVPLIFGLSILYIESVNPKNNELSHPDRQRQLGLAVWEGIKQFRDAPQPTPKHQRLVNL